MKNKAKSVDIIFTGLIRNTDIFKKSLKDIFDLRKKSLVNRIILSSWDYELDNNPKITKYLKENKVITLGNKEPKERGVGNIYCQMKSLEEGLKKASNGFILKTRTDIYIDPKFLKKIFTEKQNLLKITHNLPNGNIFKYKIWAPYFEITSVFHMGDECFFGHSEDLKHLINYENYDRDYKIRGGATHVQRYIHPFIENYPELKNYLTKHSHVGFPEDTKYYKGMRKIARKNKHILSLLNSFFVNNRFKVLKKRFKEEGYLSALAAYYSIVYSHFYINNDPVDNNLNNNSIFIRNQEPKIRVGDPEIMKNFSKDRISVRTKGHLYSFGEKFLKNIFENRVKQNNKISNQLMNTIDRFNKNN